MSYNKCIKQFKPFPMNMESKFSLLFENYSDFSIRLILFKQSLSEFEMSRAHFKFLFIRDYNSSGAAKSGKTSFNAIILIIPPTFLLFESNHHYLISSNKLHWQDCDSKIIRVADETKFVPSIFDR